MSKFFKGGGPGGTPLNQIPTIETDPGLRRFAEGRA